MFTDSAGGGCGWRDKILAKMCNNNTADIKNGFPFTSSVVWDTFSLSNIILKGEELRTIIFPKKRKYDIFIICPKERTCNNWFN